MTDLDWLLTQAFNPSSITFTSFLTLEVRQAVLPAEDTREPCHVTPSDSCLFTAVPPLETQILLHRFPNWRADMKTVGRGWRLCVHFTLLACLALTGAWLVGWIGLQLGLVLVDLGQVDIRVRMP